jgi:hypothetical protein
MKRSVHRFMAHHRPRMDCCLLRSIYLLCRVTVAHIHYPLRLSPSISGASLSGTGSPPASLGGEMMPMAALSLTSSMMVPGMQAYADPGISSHPYSMVHQSGLRHNAQSSPESSGYRSSRPAMGSSFQSLNIPQQVEQPSAQVPNQLRRTNSQSRSVPIWTSACYEIDRCAVGW